MTEDLGTPVAETTAARNRRLYGRPRIPRPDQRLMLALLATQSATAADAARLAQVSRKRAATVLFHLVRRSWAVQCLGEQPGTGYRLTPLGRANVRVILGLAGKTAHHD